MPLITKHTNLKSIKFGVGTASDRHGGGYSNQPYIVKDIPSNSSDPSNVFNTGGPDSLLRGGLMAPIKAIDDVSRLTQMFFDTRSPNGLLFTIKQNVLSRTSVKTEASIGAGTAFGNVNQGVYLPTSTIAQSLVGFVGIHGNLLGVNPFSPTNSNDELSSQKGNLGLVKYETAALYNNRETNNTFTTGVKSPPTDDTPPLESNYTTAPIAENTGFSNRLLDIWDTKQSVKNLDPNIITYGGGPGSILGIGETKIKFAGSTSRDRTGINNPLSKTNPNYFYSTGSGVNYGRNQDILRSMKNRDEKFYGASSKGEESGIGDMGIFNGFPENIIDRISGTSYVLGSGGRNNDEIDLALGVTSDGRIPRTEYATVLTSGVSSKYNTLVSNVSNGEQIDNEGFLQGNSFSVYNPLVGDSLWPTNSPLQSVNNSSTYTQTQIIEEGRNDGKLTGQPLIKDFRKTLRDGGSTNTLLTLSPGYNTDQAIDKRTFRGNPGTQNLTNNYSKGNLQALDKINASGFFDGETPTTNEYRNDLVKFSIGILKNDGSGESTYMHFRSFINSFSDAYTSEWGDVQYIGRGDKFHNYKGYSRSISMDWTCYAQSKQELIPMYKKLNFLASSLAPDYSTGGFMRGNLARLTVGGYLYNQLGIIKSLTYTVPQESTWEIGINTLGGFDNEVKELPHMINITGFSFTPIENRVPQKGSRFISLSTGAGNNNTNYAPGSYE